ncbi:DNA repair protein RecO [Haliovirga abyssi]|uniref:DNA repair protein RecO n=1 Tax=Haliovirga abyssi TaxID=2996794 RepID=A0AAU9DYI0_9FUSO|nr:DNA repair protein RecO [Haliovirga abyssi]BDU50495.1 DNA repair protein RecO [Haliovirga abyssi]
MKIKKIEGIVINKVDFGEADKIVTVISKQNGKIKILAKGIRKSKKREIYGTDLAVLSNFIIYKKNEISYLSSVELTDGFLDIKKNLFKINIAGYILKIADKFSMENEKNIKLFKLVYNSLKYISKEKENEKMLVLVSYFLNSIINQEGTSFLLNEGEYFNFEEGQFQIDKTENVLKIKKYQKKYLMLLNNVDIMGIYKLNLNKFNLLSVIEILEGYLNYHFDIKEQLKNYLGMA